MNKLIAVVGMSGTGKSVVTEYLEQKGFTKIYFGGVIYDKMREEHIEITPESQQAFREAIRKELGMGAVATLLLPKITEAYSRGDTVLDGLYSWDEYLILKEVFGANLKLLAVVTRKNLRYLRVGKRKERPFNLEEIEERDISEIENLAKGGPIAFADYYVLNNGDRDECKKNVRHILELMEKEETDDEENDK